MGMFGKLFFWKKDHFDDPLADVGKPATDPFPQDDLGISDSLGSPNYSNPNAYQQQAGFQQNYNEPSAPAFQGGNQQQYMQQQVNNRDLELISSKLDTIKALLQSLDQRTARLEKVAGVEKQRPQDRLW